MEVAIYNKYHFFHYLVSEESVEILYKKLMFRLNTKEPQFPLQRPNE